MPPPNYTITEVLDPETFAPQLAAFERTIFHEEQLGKLAFGPQSSNPESVTLRISQIKTAPSGSINRFTQAISNETGELIGASFWNLRTEPWVVKEKERDGKADREKYPKNANFELIEEAWGRALRNRIRHLEGRKCASLNILLVRPEYQRQGIGSALMEEGLNHIDEAGLPMWLGASEMGLGLYLKHGFVVDESWEVDLKKYGGDQVIQQTCMLREPKVVKAD